MPTFNNLQFYLLTDVSAIKFNIKIIAPANNKYFLTIDMSLRDILDTEI